MKVRCPKCGNDGYEVWDKDWYPGEDYMKVLCTCNECGREFEVFMELKVDSIEVIE